MSNAGQAILTIGGAIVGSFFGYPQLGLVLGSLAGQALFPTQLPGVSGPRLTDTKTTSAEVGGPVMEVFGVDCVPGNVMFLSPVLEIATTEEVGGKGGPEQEQTTYSYYQTIALGLCRGAKLGVLRIWENGQLVYDVREQQDGEDAQAYADRVAASADYQETFTLYLGTEDQEPDPTIEESEGVGNVPGFRGLMYIVYPARQLQSDQGLRHPNFKFEIQDAAYVTSRVYPIEAIDALAVEAVVMPADHPLTIEAIDIEGALLSGDLRTQLHLYEDGAPEAIDIEGVLLSGILDQVLLAYEDGAPEAIDIEGVLLSGTLEVVLVTYDEYPPEALDVDGALIAGTLT